MSTKKIIWIAILIILANISLIGIIGYSIYKNLPTNENFSPFYYFERDFKINLNGSKIISELDEIYFFGDGTFFQVIEVDNELRNIFNEWDDFTYENYKRILKYDENGNIISRYNEKTIIPDIKNGKSIFINRNYDDSDWHYSHNFSFAVYDIDNNLLYYLLENS